MVPNFHCYLIGTDHWILAHLQSSTNWGLPFAYSMKTMLVLYICFYHLVPVSVLFFI